MSSTTLTNQSPTRVIAENRVIKIAGYLRVGSCILLSVNTLACLSAAAILFWSPSASDDSLLLERIITDGKLKLSFQLGIMSFSFQSKLLIATYIALIGLFLTYCFLQLHSLFGNFCNNEIFVKRNSDLLRNLGYALIVGLLLGKLFDFAFLTVFAILDTSGQSVWDLTDLKLRLGTGFVLNVLTIGMVFLSSWILDIGRELYAEAEFTI